MDDLTALTKAALKERFGHVFLSDFDYSHLPDSSRRAVEIILGKLKNWKGDRSYLFLSAPTGGSSGFGCGKTMMMRFMFHSLSSYYLGPTEGEIIRKSRAKFLTASQLIAGLSDMSVEDFFDDDIQAVFVDDLGRESDRDTRFISGSRKDAETNSLLYSLVNYCYTRKIPLVVSANMALGDFSTYLGGASFDRLLEMCGADGIVNLSGLPSYRLHRVRNQQ